MGLTSVQVVEREGDGKVANYRADPNPNPDGAVPDFKWYTNCDSLAKRSNQHSPMPGSLSMQRRVSNDSCAYDPVTTAAFDFPLPEEFLAPASEIAIVPLTLTVSNNATTTQNLAPSTDTSNATSGSASDTPGSARVNSTVAATTVTLVSTLAPLTITVSNVSITTLRVKPSELPTIYDTAPSVFRDGNTLAPSATSSSADINNVPAPSCTMNYANSDQGVNTAFCLCNGNTTLPLLSAAATLAYTASCAYTSIPTPAPSCIVRKEDPDQGIASPLCVCEDSITLPLLPAATSLPYSASCAYTSLPPSATSNNGNDVVTVQPKVWPVTDIHGCQVCTPVINDKARCTSIPSCTPFTPGTTASVTAGSSNSLSGAT